MSAAATAARCPQSAASERRMAPRWRSCTLLPQFGYAQEVECCATEHEEPIHFRQSSQLHLLQRPDLLQPPERFLHQPPFAQADLISGMTCRSRINGATPVAGVLRDMRRHSHVPDGRDKIL